MFLTIGILSALLANYMNYTSPMDSFSSMNFTNPLSSMNFTNPLDSLSSMNFTNPMKYANSILTSVDMDPYRTTFNEFTTRVNHDPSTMILLIYSTSFFMMAAAVWFFTPRPQTLLIKNYTYESDSEYEYDDNDYEDEDYTDTMFARRRGSSKWKPHPMIRRSMAQRKPQY